MTNQTDIETRIAGLRQADEASAVTAQREKDTRFLHLFDTATAPVNEGGLGWTAAKFAEHADMTPPGVSQRVKAARRRQAAVQ